MNLANCVINGQLMGIGLKNLSDRFTDFNSCTTMSDFLCTLNLWIKRTFSNYGLMVNMYTALFDIQLYRGSHCFFVHRGFREPSSWENQEEYLVVPSYQVPQTSHSYLHFSQY